MKNTGNHQYELDLGYGGRGRYVETSRALFNRWSVFGLDRSLRLTCLSFTVHCRVGALSAETSLVQDFVTYSIRLWIKPHRIVIDAFGMTFDGGVWANLPEVIDRLEFLCFELKVEPDSEGLCRALFARGEVLEAVRLGRYSRDRAGTNTRRIVAGTDQ